MTAILFEQPWTIGIGGALLTMMLLGGWIKTWNLWLLAAAIAALSGAVILVGVERWVETPREEVQRTLLEIAADIETNDLDQILQHISEHSPGMIAKARAELPKHHFKSIKITSIEKIEINNRGHEPRAYIEFRIVVDGDFFHGQLSHRVPRFITLTMHQEEGAWKITDYEHHQPLKGMQRPDAR